jgi:hypothetical protein
MFALAQARLSAPGEQFEQYAPTMPTYANAALGEGPLGEEDRRNFHP